MKVHRKNFLNIAIIKGEIIFLKTLEQLYKAFKIIKGTECFVKEVRKSRLKTDSECFPFAVMKLKKY